ncbi:MAG TPA: hypothetical protein VFX76_05680, partial [Roseiflexaceae bacterium]|nr:hypothetical protein [Roseiflexaceae bacterium]
IKELARHPVGGGQFTSVVVPPPPQGITNTEAFASIYALDSNAGVLYRVPKAGGALETFLRPDDRFNGLEVGMVKAQAWRIDNIIAIAQNTEGGPFSFYFRSGEDWSFSNLGGSEEWGRVGNRFHAVNYDGNLYVWGALAGQLLKYTSGHFADFPLPWIQDESGRKIDAVIDLAIDGFVYLLQPDGHILVYSAGAFEREIVPAELTPPLVTPASFFVTGADPESGSIFLVDTNNERIIQINKQTGALIQQVRARPDEALRLDQLTSVYVDESASRLTLYLVNGDRILSAALPDPPAPFRESAPAGPNGTTAPPGTAGPASSSEPAPTSAPAATP